MFSKFKDALYDIIDWQTPDGNNLYIHRLAVHPEFQGRGIARQLMDYAEAYAQKEKCTAVRLDTFSKNPRNHRFYKARGYQQLGDVYFPKQSEAPFHCFEKILTP
jgi:ribosomal protein S18 acetylase RimI-like enzyme